MSIADACVKKNFVNKREMEERKDEGAKGTRRGESVD